MIWNKSKSNAVATTGPTSNANGAVAAPREITRYWLELAPAVDGGQSTRVAALVPIASGQAFRFHFVFNENGFLYIFGPGGIHNQPMAFLTTKPFPKTGVTSNKVVQGEDFSFPRGENLELDKNPGIDTFTVIFSKTALPEPAFLNAPVTGDPLTAAEQAELKALPPNTRKKRRLSNTTNQLRAHRPCASKCRLTRPAIQSSLTSVFSTIKPV